MFLRKTGGKQSHDAVQGTTTCCRNIKVPRIGGPSLWKRRSLTLT